MMDTGLTRRKPAESSPVRDLERQFTRTRPEPDQFSRTRGEPDQSHIRSGELDETKSKLLNQDLLISKPYASNPAGHQAINVSTNHGSYARDNLIWSSFPWSRAFLSLKNLALCRQRLTYVDDVVSTPPLPRQNDVDKLRGHVIRLNVLETSQLELDRFVIHPFVKIHVVDMTTGKYISKSEGKCVLGPNETMTIMNAQKAFVESGIDYIPPFATNCCDLRQEGIARARWNYSIILNEDASWLFNSNTILLFEILDFNKELIKEASTKLDHNHYYRIAWGYLRLAGLAKNHVGLSKVQLYKYRFQPSPSTAAYINKHYKRVPFVYYDFIYPDKRNYEGYLSVQVNGIPKPYLERVSRDARNIFEIEESDKDFNVTIGKFGNQPIGSQPYEDQGDPEYIKRQKMLLKRKRFPEDECRIPNDILFRFQSSPLGCFRLAFSPNGRYLAAACTYDNNKTVIKIFNVEDGVLRYTLKGHKNLIHDLSWHPSNRFLVSCSSDNTSKVWRVPEVEMNDIDEEESEKQLLVCTLFHPFYVYSSKFYMDRDTSTLIIATACFDAKVRVWRVDFENDRYVRSDPVCEEFLTFGANKNPQDGQPVNLMEHRHPNILKFDNEGRLYVGDSVGTVHVWDLNVKFNQISLSKLREINHAELSGDPINSLMILPFGKKRMLVHSRDNCIRTIDYSHPSGTKVLGRYFGSKSAKFSIRSVSSPDGQYVLSGSEDGKIYLWDFNTGDIYNTEHLGLSFVGPVTDVDWNQNYHMIAVSGFGDQYPILVFTSEVQEDEDFQKVLDRMKSFDDTSRRLDHDELSPRARRVMPEREEPGEHSFRPDFQKRRTFE